MCPSVSTENKEEVSHRLIKDNSIDKRSYQDYLVEEGLEESTLITLPTGTGKTIVSLRITANRLANVGRGTCVLLAPTKPLVEQHYETYSNLLDISEDEIKQISGDIRPEEREKIWENDPSVIISTPEVVENDLISGSIELSNVIHLTIDECHKAKGNYAYTYVADKYDEQAENKLITGLSASPGDSKEQILQICDNINVSSIEVLSEDDDRVEPYVYKTEVQKRDVEIEDEVLEMRDTLQSQYKNRLEELYKKDYIDTRSKTTPMGKLYEARGNINDAMQKGDSDAYSAMSTWAEAMKISQGIKTLETQGVESFIQYYNRIEEECRGDDPSKAAQRIISDPKIQKVVDMAREFDGTYSKFQAALAEIIQTVDQKDGKVIIFTESRDTVECLYKYIEPHFDVARLVGQSDTNESDGMSQKQQREVIERFSAGEHDVLLSTQVGEEGLDIPQVDLVLLYEPVSRSIEWIQRTGRTGRTTAGKVSVLVAQGTRDVGMYYKSQKKLESIETDYDSLKQVEDLQEEIENEIKEEKQMSLTDDFSEGESNINAEKTGSKEIKNEDKPDFKTDKPVVYADSRELNSSVVKNLDTNDDISVEVENNMEVGDFVVGPETVIERKSTEDFYQTLTQGDRSVFEQAGNMVNSYEEAILILEGGHGELYAKNIHKNAIQGALSTLITDFGVTIFESIDEEDTSDMIAQIAKDNQIDNESTVNPHGNKKNKTISEEQEYIVSSIDSVGPKMAKSLLQSDQFDSIYDIFTASKSELKNVENIGDKTAEKIYSVIREEYNQT